MVQVRVLFGSGWLSILLQVLLGVLKMVCARGVTSSYRTFLEMALEDVASTKGIFAKMALIGSLTGVSQQMALQMFKVEIGLVAVRALVLALCVFRGRRWRLACCWGGPARVGGQNPTPALLADHMQGLLFLVGEDRRMWVERGVLESQALGGCHGVIAIMGSSSGSSSSGGGGGHHGRLRVGRGDG